MKEYKTPGVYIEEIPKLPPSIASVETAIPSFVGYTEKAMNKAEGDLINKPKRIKSLLEYQTFFGYEEPEKTSLKVVFSNGGADVNGAVNEDARSKYLMYYSLQMFFDNGGGPCWVTSVGGYTGALLSDDLVNGLKEVAKINEVTLLVFPDAINLGSANDYYDVHSKAIDQCVNLQDRFTVMDVYHTKDNDWSADIESLRTLISGDTDSLKYAAVYFPRVYSNLNFSYKNPADRTKTNDASIVVEGFPGAATLAELKGKSNADYFRAITALNNIEMLIPASSAVVGVYADVDNNRGVWKAPANVNIEDVIRPEFLITNDDQKELNVDPVAGKSVNVIRYFEGRGPAIIWGARTLAGNDNEWRYISVRRYFNMVEESTKNATGQFVFEPNDENTWTRVKSMIQNYLTTQWRNGALMGASPKEAFFVHVGLGETMTELDIWEGRMIIEIGLAVVRPAEFIILKFMHKMLAES